MSNERTIIENLLAYALKPSADPKNEPALEAARAYLAQRNPSPLAPMPAPGVVGDEIASRVLQSCAAISTYPVELTAFKQRVIGDHRTLQQNVMRVFASLIDAWATEHVHSRYDMRNQATTLAAFNIRAECGDYLHFPYI